MGTNQGDDIPLVDVKPNKNSYFRATSCFENPEDSALSLVLSNDLQGLSDLLAELSADSDSAFFPDEHWINKPMGQEHKCKTLLHLAMEKSAEMTQLLLRAGARAEVYNDKLGKCPIHVAIELNSAEMLDILLRSEARIDALDQSGRTALHLATQAENLGLMQALIDNGAQVDLEDGLGRRTPLYLAAKAKNSEAVKILLANGASTKNSCFGKTIEEAIEENMPYFDIGKVEVIKKQKRNSIQDFGYGLSKILDEASMNSKKKQKNSHKLVEFKTLLTRFTAVEIDQFDAGGMRLLQKACNYGLHEFAGLLLDQGANPNQIIEGCGTSPLLFAAYHGHMDLIDLFLNHKITSIESTKTADFSVVEKSTGESVLHYLLMIPNRIEKSEAQLNNYEQCLHLILDCEDQRVQTELLKIINHKDATKNVPLHYATNLWPQSITRKLLDRGANIGIKNIWDEIPIAKIMPQTMEDFLNEKCLASNGQPVTSEELELTFDYSFLAPPIESDELCDAENQKEIEKQALPETECLWHMGQSKQHRHLLKHPVVTSFLWLKWQKIRGYFNRNLRFYFLFVTTLTWYIFARYGGVSMRTNGSNTTSIEEFKGSGFCSELASRSNIESRGIWYVLFCIQVGLQLSLMLRDWRRDVLQGCSSFGGVCRFIFITSWLDWTIIAMMISILAFNTSALWLVLTILLVMLLCREAFQMSVSLKRYMFTPENWIEGLLIGLVGVILWIPDDSFEEPCSLKRHLAAISLVLSWAEMITLVARHPKLAQYNIYVTMFYRVLTTFSLFLIWYSFFVVAFAMGFYIMLHKDTTEEKSDDDYPFFNQPWHAFVKTTIMFVGEIEFADLPIDLSSWLSFVFLLAFVFLIIVVLMNLLNGLAVSDTGYIREQAEIVSHIARVDTISYTESILLGDPLDFLGNWPPFKWVSNLPSLALMKCLFSNKTALQFLHRITGASKILLFYKTLPDKRVKCQPNKKHMSCLPLNGFPREITSAAIHILIDKEEQERKAKFTTQNDLQEDIKRLEQKLDIIMDALKLKK